MANIGIFWVFENMVFGERVDIVDASERVKGLLDSDIEHVNNWSQQQCWNSKLTAYEYQDIPQGRVLYQCNKKRYLVYLDTCLMTKATKAAIASYFGFSVQQADWRSDTHYTTASERLARLFND